MSVEHLKRPIDIEHLLHWAYGQTGILPWRGVSARALMFDHGYTVIPKGCGRAFAGGELLLERAVDDDAAFVIAAVDTLPFEIRQVVKACALQQIRPSWMAGIEPRLVERRVSWRKRSRKKDRRKGHRSHVERVWEPCSPETIRAVREVYAEWHAALGRLRSDLAGRLSGFEIKGFAASSTPWIAVLEKTA